MTQFKRLHESELEKNLGKKYIVTIEKTGDLSLLSLVTIVYLSQISTRAFSKINNKINCHHDDDSYAKNKITIDHVNDDCLAVIFMYVPAWERPKIALVCKKWKRVLDDYSWFDVKKLELTHWEFNEYQNFLKKNYPTIDRQFSFLKSLLNKCGRYLTEIDLTAYSHCNIVPVINESCPNLVKLRIRLEYIDDAILDNAFADLSKLKVLKIIFQNLINHRTHIIPVTLVNSLLNLADTLTELSLSNWSGCMIVNSDFPEEFTSVISKLKALERIQIGGINCPKSLNDYLTLKYPKIKSANDESKYHEMEIVRTEMYRYITKLSIKKYLLTDDFLYNVANQMRQLHTLQMYCDEITDAGIVTISKIKGLRFLDCYGNNNNITDSSIELLKNMRLLFLPFSNKITNKSAIKVLENSPNMHYFSVKKTGVIPFEFIKKAEEISRNRKINLEVVITCEDDTPSRQMYEYLTVEYVKKD